MHRGNHRIKAICFFSAALTASTASAAPELVAPPVVAPPVGAPVAKDEFKFEFHGFVGSSVYGQVGNFTPTGGGQAAWFVVPPELTSDKLVMGADVRQSRMNLSVTGPAINLGSKTAVPKAVVEMDFFGGTSFGGFGDSSLFPRLRILYADLAIGKTTLRFGQDHQLILGIIVPNSVGHNAFPLTYNTGTIGWRYPGITAFHTLAIGEGRTLELALQVTKSPWVVNQTAVVTDTSTTPNKTTAIPGSFGIDNGTASGLPALEARVKYKCKYLEAFVAGHISQVDKSGVGKSYASADKRNVVAGNLGFRLVLAPVTILGSGYLGKNTAPLLGNILQFQAVTEDIGDIQVMGGWGQVGANIIPELSAWALIGTEKPNKTDVINAKQTRLQNTVISGLVRYQNKGFTLGLEYTYWNTLTRMDAASGAASTTGIGKNLTATQLMLTGLYYF